jgi:hypothetical protein
MKTFTVNLPEVAEITEAYLMFKYIELFSVLGVIVLSTWGIYRVAKREGLL